MGGSQPRVFCPSPGAWVTAGDFRAVTTARRMLLAAGGQRPGVLLAARQPWKPLLLSQVNNSMSYTLQESVGVASTVPPVNVP